MPQRDDTLKQDLAASLDATPDLLPFIPELVADIWVLGSRPDIILDLLRPLRLPAHSTQVLDLGCGKGAVALPLAGEFGFKVFGIDLFEPFIKEAEKRAREMEVTHLCRFEVADIRDTLQKDRDFDVVICASVGGALGNFESCVGKLRRSIHPGGYMIIDDGFLSGSQKIERPGYEHYASHDETLRQLTSHGDELVCEVLEPVAEIKSYNRKNTELIRQRAEQLAQRHPDMAASFAWYVKRQERESEILETDTIGAVWLLRRA